MIDTISTATGLALTLVLLYFYLDVLAWLRLYRVFAAMGGLAFFFLTSVTFVGTFALLLFVWGFVTRHFLIITRLLTVAEAKFYPLGFHSSWPETWQEGDP